MDNNEPKEQQQKLFCGKGNVFNENGIAVSLCLSRVPLEHIHKNETTDEEWINLTLWKLREPREGKTHSLQVDVNHPMNRDKN